MPYSKVLCWRKMADKLAAEVKEMEERQRLVQEESIKLKHKCDEYEMMWKKHLSDLYFFLNLMFNNLFKLHSLGEGNSQLGRELRVEGFPALCCLTKSFTSVM